MKGIGKDRAGLSQRVAMAQAQSIQNKELLQEKDPAKRRARLDALAATAADAARCREYLLRASLIAMVREANATP